MDNSEILKPLGEGLEGYTVIGLDVVDQLADLPSFVLSDFFNEFPLYDYEPGTTATLGNLMTINSILEVPIYPSDSDPVGLLTFTATSSNPSVVLPSIEASQLTLTSVNPGEAEILVQATESGGYVVDIRFDVTVLTEPPVIVSQPVSRAVVSGTTLQLTVDATGTGAITFAWMKDGEVLVPSGNYAGIDTDTLTIREVSAEDMGSFTVSISNGGGTTDAGAAVGAALPLPYRRYR